MNYYLLNTMPLEDDAYCFLELPPTPIETIDYKIAQGETIAAEYPADVRMYMDKANPGVKLSDLVANSRGIIIASKPLKEGIERVNTAPTEYLPVSIYNHKKRLASAAYFIINPLGAVDCLDLQRSEIEWDGADVVSIEKLVLDPGKLKGVPDLFRIKEDLMQYVMSEKLARSLVPLDPSNFYLIELEQAP
jgi:hypothetical protein